MFVLRKLSYDNKETKKEGAYYTLNFALGDSYTKITAKDSPIQFEWTAKNGDYDVEGDGIFAFVSGEKGNIFPLYKAQYNYIMTEKGDTFEYISK